MKRADDNEIRRKPWSASAPMRFAQVLGKLFGERTVIAEGPRGTVLCKCSCGNEDYVALAELRRGRAGVCVRCARRRTQARRRPQHTANRLSAGYTPGSVFRQLTLVRLLEKTRWLCRCACGAEVVVSEQRLRGTAYGCRACGTKKRAVALRDPVIAVDGKLYAKCEIAAVCQVSGECIRRWCSYGWTGDEMLRYAAALHVAKKKQRPSARRK